MTLKYGRSLTMCGAGVGLTDASDAARLVTHEKGRVPPPAGTPKQRARTAPSSDTLASPMQGNVWKLPVAQGQPVAEGDVIAIIEAMKMENEITAHKAGVIAELPISVGDSVRSGDVLAVIRDPAR